MIVTNGFPKDVTDHDFMAYRQEAYAVTPKQTVLKQIPEMKLHNYAFANNGDLTFKDVSKNGASTSYLFKRSCLCRSG